MSEYATVQLTARLMNPGTPNEFVRVFVACGDGHDLGSTPLEFLLNRAKDGRPGVEFDIPAHHFHPEAVTA